MRRQAGPDKKIKTESFKHNKYTQHKSKEIEIQNANAAH